MPRKERPSPETIKAQIKSVIMPKVKGTALEAEFQGDIIQDLDRVLGSRSSEFFALFSNKEKERLSGWLKIYNSL